MRFTRRKALASIGAVGIGGSAVFGSGAFTQTAVDRSFDLAIDNDEDAALALEPNDGDYESEAVSQEDGVLKFDFDEFADAEGINSQGDTAFERLFTITNNTSHSLWVWMPTAVEAPNGVEGIPDPPEEITSDGEFFDQIYDSGNRSVEFGAHTSEVDDDQFDESLGTRLEDDIVDLSFPEGLHKDWNEQDNDPDVGTPSGSGAGEQSRAFGMAPGGAVKLDAETTVPVDVNFLVEGADAPRAEASLFVRLVAERDEPTGFENENDVESDWITTFFNVDGLID